MGCPRRSRDISPRLIPLNFVRFLESSFTLLSLLHLVLRVLFSKPLSLCYHTQHAHYRDILHLVESYHLMDSSFRSTVAQDGNRVAGLRRTRSPMPKSYQSQPTSFENSIRSTISRCPSLPSFHFPKIASTEPSFLSRVQDVRRPSSANTIQRSVSGMKRLLPLKLTSPPLPSSGSWHSPVSDSKPELEPTRLSTRSAQLAVPDQAFAGKRPSLTIRPEQYQDTPIYTGPGSPLLSRAYYTEEDVCRTCSPGSSCDESCIIQGYSSNEDSESETTYADCLDFFSSGEDVSTPATSPAVERARHSELSFKCLGDTFFDEGSWLRSTTKRDRIHIPDCLTQRLANSMAASIDIRGWVSDSTGSSCGESEDDDDLVSEISQPRIFLIY